MKNITSIVNHISFNNIFSACRDESGKIDWRKVVQVKDLPDDLIDKYFFQLQKFALEKEQHLTPDIISKYKGRLNWPMLLKFHRFTDEDLEYCFQVIKDRQFGWAFLKFVVYDLPFIIRHKDDIVKIANHIEHINSNMMLTNEKKTDIVLWLQKYESEQQP